MASDDGAQHAPAPPPPPLPPPPPSRTRDGPFVLRTLLEDVPLAADGDGAGAGVRINCVEFYDGNLYVGTSESELLHFVQIPPDPADLSSRPSFILASRLQPPHAPLPEQAVRPGIQQLVLLPKIGKAVILCNYTVTFYLLPELSPTFKDMQVKNASGIGGVDLDDAGADDANGGDTLLLSLSRKLRVVKLRGEEPRVLRTIDFGGNITSVRRGTIACVADTRNYALLDIERQLKIPLMSISSLDDSQPPGEIGQAQPIGPVSDTSQRGHNSRPSSLISPFQSHSRNSSLTGFLGAPNRRDHRSADLDVASLFSPSPPPANQNPRPPPEGGGGAADPPRSVTPTPAQKDGPRPPPLLKPHLASPTPEEFLLVTGTRPTEPGIGMFVNLDGDATRPPLEFETYPLSIAVEAQQADPASSPQMDQQEDGYVFASLVREKDDFIEYGLEIQRWGSGGAAPSIFWLQADGATSQGPYGVRAVLGSETTQFLDVVDKLCRTKFLPPAPTTTKFLSRTDSRAALSVERVSKEKELFEKDDPADEDPQLPADWEARRNGEEREFARRLAGATARMVVWAGRHIWWAVRNPAILQLEAALEDEPDTAAILAVLASVRGRDALTELDFMTFNYIRQRAGVLLFGHLLRSGDSFGAAEMQVFEDALVESELDPRIVLALVPRLREEIIVDQRGIWIFGGVKATVDGLLGVEGDSHPSADSLSAFLGPLVLAFLKRFLFSWRRKKGFGSVDDKHLFSTVDAALLIVLLELDKASPPGSPAKNGSVRQELYEIVDRGVDCFEHAVALLEAHHRLYVLSRLYQSRKMAADVLATWRRIVEGARDDGGEFAAADGERRVREYLAKISSQALVQEYGLWLAARNPRLGVQVFADDASRAPKFVAVQVVALLKEHAPDAVKYYLEHLVFTKGHHGYVNDLISHYLAVVVGDIESSEASRDAYRLAAEAYRALHPPKPTFHHFLAANAAPDNEPWQSRLRLLQLLGGAHSYDAKAILARIATVADELLVPEIIILAGREGRHEDALRLLVHRLGDHDTAVAYCLRGGSTIYGAVVPRLRGPAATAAPTTMTSLSSTPALLDDAARTRLFRALLGEFLSIADPAERQDQTGMLLARFGAHFDVADVLAQLPDSWPVHAVAAFLASALRRLATERREVHVVTALRQAESVRVSYDWVVKMEDAGGTVELPDSGVDLSEA